MKNQEIKIEEKLKLQLKRTQIGGRLLMYIGSITIILLMGFIYGNNQGYWDNSFGDAIGGITAPFVGLLAAVLVYMSFLQQLRANQLQITANAENKRRLDESELAKTQNENYSMMRDYARLTVSLHNKKLEKIKQMNEEISRYIGMLEQGVKLTEETKFLFRQLLINFSRVCSNLENFTTFLYVLDETDMTELQKFIILREFNTLNKEYFIQIRETAYMLATNHNDRTSNLPQKEKDLISKSYRATSDFEDYYEEIWLKYILVAKAEKRNHN